MAFNLDNPFIAMLLAVAEAQGKDALKKVLQNVHDKNEQNYKLILVESYPLIDTKLEDFVKASEAKWDDNAVQALKEALEESAKANSFTLPNIDED